MDHPQSAAEWNMGKIKQDNIHKTKLMTKWQHMRGNEALPRVDEFCQVDGFEFDFVHIPCVKLSLSSVELEEGKYETDEGEYEAEECKYEVGEGGIWVIFTLV